MNNFTRWFIIFSAVITAFSLLLYNGIIQLILISDSSYISMSIMSLFLLSSIFLGKTCYEFDKTDGKIDINKKLNIFKFIAGNLTSLGLLGTLIGMSMMMYNTLDGSSIDVGTIVNQLKSGCSVAFYTTLVGIISSLLLNLQIFVFENRIKDI